MEAEGIYLDYSKHRVTAETMRLLVALAEACGLRERIDAMFRGDRINVTENRSVLHVALRAPRDESIVVDGTDVVKDVHAVLDRMGDFSDRVRSGDWVGHTGKRIRNVINIGIGGSDLGPVMAYEALRHYSERSMRLPLRVQRRRHRFRRGHARPRPGRDAVHRLVQDLHHAGDDDQRPQRARVVAARARGRRGGGGQALRGRLHQRGGREGVRHRPGQHVRLLGVGRRPLLDGLGHRALDHGGDRARGLRRAAGRLPRRRRALPHHAVSAQPARAHGAAVGLVPGLLRRPDGRRAALRPVPQALPRLPPAAHDGVQRQARDAGRRARGLRHWRHLLGRARHERPALLLPAHPPGHGGDPVRLHRLHQDPEPAR